MARRASQGASQGASRGAAQRLAVALRRLRRAPGRVRATWRRSLQLRVVATTTVLSLVAVGAAGAYLAGQISERLFDSRRAQVITEARRGAQDAQARLDQFAADTPNDVRDRAQTLLGQLEGVGPDRDRRVLLLRPPGHGEQTSIGDSLYSTGLDGGPSVVPAALRRAVRSSGQQQTQSIGVRAGETVQPWLAVGEMVRVPLAGRYELYFLFDLSREQATLQRVQQVLLVGAAVLVLLVGVVAAVVTHQVVGPVRQAAAVASRLSSGRLDERMHVHGEDDLARLAGSFNRMADNLQQQIVRLEQLGALQQRFVSDVSHELRTPLTTIRMAGEVLHEARAAMAPGVARSAELLATQLDRFEDLLADLLEISRYDAGAAALDTDGVDLRVLAQQAVDEAAPLAERRGSALRLDAPGAPCAAEVDRRRVQRILRNLVVNAVEHGEGRPVEVAVACDGDAVAVRVRDHGVGLSPAEAARVFDRFWRADPARARTSGGTGLGLAISLEDAHLHGGRLEVAGRRGTGATFLLTLPRTAGAPLGAASPLPLRERPALGAAPPRPAPGPEHQPVAGG